MLLVELRELEIWVSRLSSGELEEVEDEVSGDGLTHGRYLPVRTYGSMPPMEGPVP